MDERRSRSRRRTLKSGKIVFNHKGSVVDCIIRNLSDAGACLQTGDVVGVPDTFELVVDGVSRRCSVEWRALNRMGILFQ